MENIIHFAVIVCRNGIIRGADLNLRSIAAAAPPAAATEPHPPSPGAAPPAPAPPSFSENPLRDALQRLLREASPNLYQSVEETLVHSAFSHVGENQVRAARALGITRNTLRTLLKRHGLLARSPGDDSDDEPAA